MDICGTEENIPNRFLLTGGIEVICILVGGQFGPKKGETTRNTFCFSIRYRLSKLRFRLPVFFSGVASAQSTENYLIFGGSGLSPV